MVDYGTKVRQYRGRGRTADIKYWHVPPTEISDSTIIMDITCSVENICVFIFHICDNLEKWQFLTEIRSLFVVCPFTFNSFHFFFYCDVIIKMHAKTHGKQFYLFIYLFIYLFTYLKYSKSNRRQEKPYRNRM